MPWCATDGAICLPGLLAFSGRHAWWQEFLLTSEEVRAKPWKRPDFLIRGVFSGQQASHLRDECLRCCYTPPPYTNARLLSVGRFHLGFPQYTRGTGSFCVCQGLVDTVSTVASSTLFCPLFSEKKHQLLRLGTRTSPCETRTYACVDFSSSPEHLEGRYLAVRSLEVKLQIEWQSARQK